MRRVCSTAPVLAPWWSSRPPSRVCCHASRRAFALCSKLCSGNHPPNTPASSYAPPSFPHLLRIVIRALAPSRIYPRCRQCRTPHPPCRESAREALSRQTVSPATALLPGHQSSSLQFHFLGCGELEEKNARNQNIGRSAA